MKVLARKVLSLINRYEDYMEPYRSTRSYSRNLQNILSDRAILEAADFVSQHLSTSMIFRTKSEVWDYVAGKVSERYDSGVCLEFGVAHGASINWMSKKMPNLQFFGFDSFAGLSEDWLGHSLKKGAFNRNGELPRVNKNVTLIKGWFDQTVPQFLSKSNLSNVRLIHIDCDTYEAATIVFNALGRDLATGVLVLFDELLGYPGWKDGELKALLEAEKRYGFKYRYLAFSSQQALIQIL